jgi:hypothetical protein
MKLNLAGKNTCGAKIFAAKAQNKKQNDKAK